MAQRFCSVKKINHVDEAIKDLSHELWHKNMERNLCVSFFTHNKNKFLELSHSVPAFNCKMNKGTHEMDMFLEHQGLFLLKEFVDFKVIEFEENYEIRRA